LVSRLRYWASVLAATSRASSHVAHHCARVVFPAAGSIQVPWRCSDSSVWACGRRLFWWGNRWWIPGCRRLCGSGRARIFCRVVRPRPSGPPVAARNRGGVGFDGHMDACVLTKSKGPPRRSPFPAVGCGGWVWSSVPWAASGGVGGACAGGGDGAEIGGGEAEVSPEKGAGNGAGRGFVTQPGFADRQQSRRLGGGVEAGDLTVVVALSGAGVADCGERREGLRGAVLRTGRGVPAGGCRSPGAR
jgi:hypothetical protein